MGRVSSVFTLIVVTFLGSLADSFSQANPVASTFYGDIQMYRTAKSYDVPPVVFPHWAHRVQFTCQVCHSAIFRMEAGTHEILMERMAAQGTFCMRCHDGNVAWKPVNCARCHRGQEGVAAADTTRTTLPKFGPPFSRENADPERLLRNFPRDPDGNIDWIQAIRRKLISPASSLRPARSVTVPIPADILLPQTDTLPPVVFSHASHALWLDCENCHSSIFIAKKDANPISMAAIWAGRYCGKCHGKVAFPVTNCERCHPQSSREK